MLSYNDNIHPGRLDVNEHKDGPKPITSSWEKVSKDFNAPPPIERKVMYFIDDEQGETIGKCEDLVSVRRFLDSEHFKERDLVVRPYEYTEEELRLYISQMRQQGRWESGFGA